MAPRTTSRGLPVVSRETVEAITSRYLGRRQGESTDWGVFLMGVKERLLAENPQLVAFIEAQVGGFPQGLHRPIFDVLVRMYGLLEHQAYANTFE